MNSLQDLNLHDNFQENDSYIEEFTSTELLDLFIKYLNKKLKLEENPKAMLTYKKDFSFECKDGDTYKFISSFTLDELLDSCNDVTCDDSLFENKEELISTIKESLGDKALDRITREIWSRFNITPLESSR